MSTYELLNLYPHNIKTCEKIREAFNNGEDIVSIIKATGTGKSYIGLNLALEHKDEKIIWLVPTNAIKEHILQIINSNPNLSIERDFPNLEIRTYSSLVDLTDEEIKDIPCDLLIVDELHHIGAPVWGEKVNTLIYTHPDIKTFGMSAYSVRDRGTSYERDMTNPETEEIFSGTVVDRYDLYDAIIDGVLPLPVTKTVLSEDSVIFEELQDALNVKKLTKRKVQKEIEIAIDTITKTIHKQNPIKEIIQETVTENGKYIYFCPVYSYEGINDMDTIIEQVVGDIKEKYPDKRIVVYKTTSDMGREGDKNRDCFYHDVDLEGHDTSNTIRIMFAKNQYNEGVHAPNVDGVFLGRKTESDIVALEQIGRTLSVRENIKEKRLEYNIFEIDKLKQLAIRKGIIFDEDITKEQLIELLVSPVIIDLTGNIEFLEELETNLKTRVKERRKESKRNRERLEFIEKYSPIMLSSQKKEILVSLLNLKKQAQRETWDDCYALALVYFNQYQNSEIPVDFKTKDGITFDKDGISLGTWCKTQRYRKEKLTEERMQKLKQINFRFEDKNDLIWQQKYELAKKYFEYYKNSEIPIDFKTNDGITYDKSGVYLGKWCDHQKQRKRKNMLSEERIKKLNDINFNFENKTEISWHKMYNLVKKYYKHFGNTEIKKDFKTKDGITYDKNGVSLGSWCDNQRTKQEKLSQEKTRKLEEINFRFQSKDDFYWQKMYNLAKIYNEHYGNLEIPSKFKTKNGIDYDENGETLGSWKESQRASFKKNTLEEEKIQKLKLINFNFESNVYELAWQKMYNLAKTYYDYYGHSEIPGGFKTKDGINFDENGSHLGVWCKGQKTFFKGYILGSDQTMDSRIKLLENIEFIFGDKREFMWQKMYNLAKKYYDYYGHSEIPGSFKTKDGINFDKNGEPLGEWCKNIRVSFKKNKFEDNKNKDERIKKLDLIEFRYKLRKETENEKIELCQTYNIEFNKYKILAKMSYQELYAKIMFLLDNNISLEINNKLHPIFTMCNENIMINYGISKEELITNYYINKKERK